jgi:predicted alpha/beta superfamily hydrolase
MLLNSSRCVWYGGVAGEWQGANGVSIDARRMIGVARLPSVHGCKAQACRTLAPMSEQRTEDLPWFLRDTPKQEIPPVETHLIDSKNVDQTYRIQVMQPARNNGEEPPRVPVVYATDANWTFDMFKALSYLIQLGEADSPPYILVGISYPSEFPHAGMILRGRDFTFPPYPKWNREKIPRKFDEVLEPREGSKDFFGGEDFRNFIHEELIPFVDARYPTISGDRTYFGHSGGGYFGLYTMFSRPEVFKNYIVSSPGLVYHGLAADGQILDHNNFGLELAQTFAEAGGTLEGTRLYLSAGAEEDWEPALMGWEVTSGAYRFAKLLKQLRIPGLELMFEAFPNETHMTAWPIAFMHGVQAMLGSRRVYDCVYFD